MNRLKLFWHFYKAKQNTTMSSSSIKAMQDKKLRNLLKHAYNHSEFYRKSFHNAGITAENLHSLPLSAFPTIDKKILLENFDSVVTSNDVCQKDLIRFDELQKEKSGLYKDKYHIVHSSGSTGKPGYFVYDEKAWDTMLIGIIRAALWNG